MTTKLRLFNVRFKRFDFSGELITAFFYVHVSEAGHAKITHKAINSSLLCIYSTFNRENIYQLSEKSFWYVESRLKYIFSEGSRYKVENTAWNLENFFRKNPNKAGANGCRTFSRDSFSWCEMQKVAEIYLLIYLFYWQFMTWRKMLRVIKNSKFV